VTNAAAAIPGQFEETDEQLRIRRDASTTTTAQSVLDAIRGAILNIPNVEECRIYENYSDEVDGNGQAAHSIDIVVLGGADQDIYNAIWLKKPVGTTLIGTSVGSVTDSAGDAQVVKFDRPTPVPIYVIVNMHGLTGWPTTGIADLKNAIVAWALANLVMGEEVVWSQLFIPINSIPGVSVDSLYIGTTPAPTGVADISIAFNALADFSTTNITVNVAS
jgi:uncharacterized phage protein gp47/JayE